MKILKSINLILILFTVLSISAQTTQPTNATALLDEVAQKLEAYNTLKIEFNIYTDNGQTGKKENYAGLGLYKAGLYKLDVMGQIIFSDGKTNWSYLKDAEEVNITTNDPKQETLINPKNILKNYKEDFKVTQIGDKFEKNRALLEVNLYPKQIDSKKFSMIVLKIDKTKKEIYSIKYVGKDGLTYTIEINKFTANGNINDSDIKYSNALFPDAEIIDMR